MRKSEQCLSFLPFSCLGCCCCQGFSHPPTVRRSEPSAPLHLSTNSINSISAKIFLSRSNQWSPSVRSRLASWAMLIADICIVGLAAAVRHVDTLQYSSRKWLSKVHGVLQDCYRKAPILLIESYYSLNGNTFDCALPTPNKRIMYSTSGNLLDRL